MFVINFVGRDFVWNQLAPLFFMAAGGYNVFDAFGYI